MKVEKFTCDSCGFETFKESEIKNVQVQVEIEDIKWFHVCTTCWPEKKKSVFKIFFNKVCGAREPGGVVR